MSTGDAPAPLFYLAGLLGWNYFAQTFNSTSGVFTNNRELFHKVYFPRLAVPISSTISNLPALLLNLVLFVVIAAIYGLCNPETTCLNIDSPALLLLVPLLILIAGATGLATGLWISALTAAYRDLSHLASFLVQLWMYSTPIIYTFASVPERWKPLLALNPMTAVCEGFKRIFLGPGTGTLSTPMLASATALSLGALYLGFLLFRHAEDKFIDAI